MHIDETKIIGDDSHIFLHRSHHFLAQLLHARGKSSIALDCLQKHLRNVRQHEQNVRDSNAGQIKKRFQIAHF